MRKKLSDYIVEKLSEYGIRHVFIVSGGASIHILHSLADSNAIAPVCPHHEQAGAMAADAYARVTGNIGCAVGTSGPGATNLITGIAGAWFDSVPALFLSGQVATFRLKGKSGVRQFGFQETEIIPMVKPITKYCVQLRDPMRVRYEIEKAIYIAKSGRPGPALIDIPDDLQRSFIETDDLVGYAPKAAAGPAAPAHDDIVQTLKILKAAERPVVVFGYGVRLSGAVDAGRALVEAWQIPVLTSWGAKDMLAGDDPLNVGTFGTHGTRAGNFTIQNADCVVSIGARLSTRETGAPLSSWARGAKTIIIDIDPAELRKFPMFQRPLDVSIVSDAKVAINALSEATKSDVMPDWSVWRAVVTDWKKRYPACPPDASSDTTVNPYTLMEILPGLAADNAHFFIDTGCAIAWSMQGMKLKAGQRTFHDFNNTAMGWALPAAMAGALAKPEIQPICIAGDGSMMMNIQELATIRYHRLPVKVLLLDNGGYSMVRQTEDQWLQGKNVGTSKESGLGFPDFFKLAESFGFATTHVETNADLGRAVRNLLTESGPAFLRVVIPHEKRVTPQVAFGYPIEDSEPHLPRDEFLANMKVAPMPVSLRHLK